MSSPWRSSGLFALPNSTSAWRICGGGPCAIGAEENLMPRSPCAWLRLCAKNTLANDDSCCRSCPMHSWGRSAAHYFNLLSHSFTQERSAPRRTCIGLLFSISRLRWTNCGRISTRNGETSSLGQKKTGLKVIAGTGDRRIPEFCRMYDQMRKRKAFETTVDVEEFGRIQENLPETHRMRILICEQNGVPVAGLLPRRWVIPRSICWVRPATTA